MFFSTDSNTFLTEAQAILPASVSIDREKLWPFIEQAERKYIKPLLEEDLYDDLQTFFNDHDNWTSGSGEDEEKSTELLRLIRIAELNLAFFIGFDVLNVILGGSGFQRSETANFKGLYKYQESNLKSYFETTGLNGLDDMLKYIEDNIEHFPEWEESSIFASRKTAIIKDAETFDGICFINKSRLIFLRLQRHMTEVIDFDIKPLLGDEYDTLLTELAKEDPADNYAALIPYIQKPLAYLSCAKLIEKTGNLTDRGLFFEGRNSLFPDTSTERSATLDEIAASRIQYESIGNKYLEALRQYLIANSFTEQGSVGGNVFSRDNTDKKIFIA
jgi:hypothetical protein